MKNKLSGLAILLSFSYSAFARAGGVPLPPPAVPSTSPDVRPESNAEYCRINPESAACVDVRVGGAWMCSDGSPCGASVGCDDSSSCTFYQN